MTVHKLPILLEPQPEGGYVVTSHVVPELVTEGDTVQEALANSQDAIASLIEAFGELNKPLPAALQSSAETTIRPSP